MSDDSIHNEVLTIPKDREIKVVNSARVPLSFTMVGNGAINRRTNMKSIDLLTMMETIPAIGIEALNKIRKSVNWEQDIETDEYFTVGVAYLPAAEFTNASRTRFQKGVKLLKDLDLVRKLGRNDYMLNPYAVLPTRVKTAVKLWEEQNDK